MRNRCSNARCFGPSPPKPNSLLIRVAKEHNQQPQAQEQPVKTSWNKWETTNFGDGEKNEKFRRLMGIKSAEPPKAVPAAAAPSAVLSPEQQRKMQSDRDQL